MKFDICALTHFLAQRRILFKMISFTYRMTMYFKEVVVRENRRRTILNKLVQIGKTFSAPLLKTQLKCEVFPVFQ